MALLRSTLERLLLGILTLIACAVFIRLGFWQWGRGTAREVEAERFERGAQVLRELGSGATTSVPLYQRVRVTGTLDGAHQFLLDNRSFQGQPGYEVLTPLARAGGTTLLIDRGWVPFTGSRKVLPDVRVPDGAAAAYTGRIAPLPSPGLALGRAAPQPPWPQVTSFPDMAELEAAYGAPLEPFILLLDPGVPGGYARDWRIGGVSPLRHFSYAIQWWAFAGLAALVWGVMTWRARLRVPR